MFKTSDEIQAFFYGITEVLPYQFNNSTKFSKALISPLRLAIK